MSPGARPPERVGQGRSALLFVSLGLALVGGGVDRIRRILRAVRTAPRSVAEVVGFVPDSQAVVVRPVQDDRPDGVLVAVRLVGGNRHLVAGDRVVYVGPWERPSGWLAKVEGDLIGLAGPYGTVWGYRASFARPVMSDPPDGHPVRVAPRRDESR